VRAVIHACLRWAWPLRLEQHRSRVCARSAFSWCFFFGSWLGGCLFSGLVPPAIRSALPIKPSPSAWPKRPRGAAPGSCFLSGFPAGHGLHRCGPWPSPGDAVWPLVLNASLAAMRPVAAEAAPTGAASLRLARGGGLSPPAQWPWPPRLARGRLAPAGCRPQPWVMTWPSDEPVPMAPCSPPVQWAESEKPA